MKTMNFRLLVLSLLTLLFTGHANAEDVTAHWDWQNANPESITTTNIQGTDATGTVDSDVEGIELTVLAAVEGTNIKLAYNASGYVQFNANTAIRVPVKSSGDSVIVVSYPGQYNYTVGGTAAQGNETVYTANATDVKNGYVEIVATKTAYLYSIKLVQISKIQEKELYSTDFSEWEVAAATAPATNVSKKTKYSSENLTFTLYQTQVISVTDSKFSAYTELPRMALRAEKNKGSYILTSTLASITKVHFIHGATGSNRGWKLEAKGDGDADWVVISDAVASPSAWSEVEATVNKTNVQLRFTNLADGQNAFLFNLDIYGMVDMGSTPMLGTFKANGETIVAGDIFTEQADGSMAATIELSKSATMISSENPITEVVADNGEVGTITYEGSATSCKVTIPVTLGTKTLNYVATFVQKPDFTLTYYDTDGTKMGTQTVEKDAAIGTFTVDYTTAKAGEGYKVRGWFVKEDGGRKFTTDEIITENISLYAVASMIETADTKSRYTFALNDQYFYAEDHESFNPEGTGKWHDATHGWVFAAGDKIIVPVGGDANLTLSLCQYSSAAAITITDKEENTVATISSAKASSDGATTLVSYTGAATELTITFAGTCYLHKLSVANIAENPVVKEDNWYIVNAGDATSLLNTIDVVNSANNTADAEPCYVFIPNGTYDLGELVLTNISGYNISFVGQSMTGTIIKNAPAIEIEGIGTTATFYNTGVNNYFQDMTIQNALDYYGAIAKGMGGGRAVCFWDKGTKSILKNVTMLSYQDTYYSNNNSMQSYWEDCDIHGTVDFICGGGDVRFQNTTLTLEKRNSDGKGGRTITAPTTTTSFGYVFDNCKIVDLSESKGDWNFGRTWQEYPICIYLNTTLDEVAAKTIVSSRWTQKGMNNKDPKVFGEYGTKNVSGTDITPASNVITSYGGTFQTILTAEQAAAYSYDKMFTNWAPATESALLEAPEATYADGMLTITSLDNGATAYLIEKNGEFAGITSEESFTITINPSYDVLTIRAANGRGGFGVAKKVSAIPSAINKVHGQAQQDEQVIYNLAGQRVKSANAGACIVNGKKMILK